MQNQILRQHWSDPSQLTLPRESVIAPGCTHRVMWCSGFKMGKLPACGQPIMTLSLLMISGGVRNVKISNGSPELNKFVAGAEVTRQL